MKGILQKIKIARAFLRKRFLYFAHLFEGRTQGEFISDATVKRRRRVLHYCYNFVFAAVVAVVLSNIWSPPNPPPLYHPGDIADQDIIAPITLDIEPREAPTAQRDEITRRVAPVFDYDDTSTTTWADSWGNGLKKIRGEFYSGRKSTKSNLQEAIAQRIQTYTGQTLPSHDLAFLMQNRFDTSLEEFFSTAGRAFQGRLIAQSDLFPNYYSTGIVVRQINQSLDETLVQDVSRIWSTEYAREFLKYVLNNKRKLNTPKEKRMFDLVSSLVQPNLRMNDDVTRKRIERALGLTRHSLVSLKKGEPIIRRGERVTEQTARLLENVATLVTPTAVVEQFLLIFLVMFLFLSVLFRMDITKKGFWTLSLKDALFFMGIAVLNLLTVKVTFPLMKQFFDEFHLVLGVEYLIPISAGGIIIHLMMGKEAAYTYALMMSVAIGSLLEKSFFFSIWAFTVTASAIQSIRACKQRTDLYRSGIWSGTVGSLLVVAFSILHTMGFQKVGWSALGVTVGLAFVSGLLATVITSSLIPLLEAIFGYTTSLKLLELSNFNHSLLLSLMMEAPGTYHHSVIVGSLAEIAADGIKANSLLARVSAYYHDIGKMTKPLYFIENQAPNNNPHDHLSPTMSAKILFSHVKNGVRLGREHNLGHKIIDIIEQHHGTTLAAYFYNKAKRTENKELDAVTENEFRYPGPKPQSREAAIVMIADACEAATRSITDPTPAKIQSMVSHIIQKRLNEEQFNECDITLSDLKVIEESFTRTLVSLYHHRIQYPSEKKDSPVAPPDAATEKKILSGS